MIWEQCYRDALENVGFTSGLSNPCLFDHQERDISIVVHGDDFTALGTDLDLDWYTTEVEKVFEIKVRGRLGEGTTDKEIRILNRVIRITPEGVRYEAAPRHYELIARSLGLEAGTPVLTPGVKPSQPEESTFKGDEHIIDGNVVDITGRISKALTGPNGEVAITENDGNLTERSKSLKDIMAGNPNHNNIDDQPGSVGMAACRSVDMSGLLRSSVRRSGITKTKHEQSPMTLTIAMMLFHTQNAIPSLPNPS